MNNSIKISETGANIYHWHPSTLNHSVLFCSENASFGIGKSIRGGIPICWPWFGPKEDHPQHGYVRVSLWKIINQDLNTDHGSITFELGHEDVVSPEFKFRLVYKVSYEQQELTASLTTQNLDDTTIKISQALHTYLSIGDISKIEINGCDGHLYIDKTDAFSEQIQKGAITVSSEIDRIYKAVNKAIIHDPVLRRNIIVSSAGASDTVIWNPWEEKTRDIKDLTDIDYKNFVCVEAANASEEISIVPNSEYTISTMIKVEKLA